MSTNTKDKNVKHMWIVKCPACKSKLEVLESHVKINKRGQAYITCPNRAGHKRHNPFSFPISEEKVTSDPELSKVVERKRKALGLSRVKKEEEQQPQKLIEEPKVIESEESPEEDSIIPEYPTPDMSDDEISSIIRRRGRPALDKLKKITLERKLEKVGMPKDPLTFVLEDFEKYPDVRNNPQLLFEAIKGYANLGKGQKITDFYIQRVVSEVAELERAYGRFTDPLNPMGFFLPNPSLNPLWLPLPPEGTGSVMSVGETRNVVPPEGYLTESEAKDRVAKALKEREKEEEDRKAQARREEEIKKLDEEIHNLEMMLLQRQSASNPGGNQNLAPLLGATLKNIQPAGNQDLSPLLDTILKNIQPARGERSELSKTAFKEAVSILKNASEAKALGVPAGTPVSVWVETLKMAHERDLKKSDMIKAEKAREKKSKLVNDILGTLGPAIPEIANAMGSSAPREAKVSTILTTLKNIMEIYTENT